MECKEISSLFNRLVSGMLPLYKWERVPQTYMLKDCSESLRNLQRPTRFLVVLELAVEVGGYG